MDETATLPADPAAEQDGQSLGDKLAAQVQQRIKEAMDQRRGSGIEEIWDEDTDQYNGFDDLSLPSKGVKDQGNASTKPRADGRSRVFVNITKPKTDSAVARVAEMLLPNDDKPWGIEPTPIPDIDEDETYQLADGTKAKGKDVAAVVMARAAEKADAMADWIEDKFVEGSVYGEMRKVVRDAGRIGTGVLKGPFMVGRDKRKWSIAGGIASLEISAEVAPTSKRVDPRDFFPDPACGEDIHAGSYCVERDYLTARQLRALAKDPTYDRQAIAAALKEGPSVRARDYNRFQDNPGETLIDSAVFEVYYYYGDVDPATLMDLGVPEAEIGMDAAAVSELDEAMLQLVSMPAIVTMLNGKPIKAAVNPLDTGEFPFDVFPWEPMDGQVWGRGVPRKMATAQRIVNASTRAMLENAGLSGGVQIGITEGALEPADGRYEIVGRKLWKFKANDFISDIRQAMQIWTIPSVQQELMNIIDFGLKMADEMTNLPMVMQGQSNREGGASAETLGGMTLAMNAATAPLRVIAKQFDDYLVIRHLRRYYDLGMQMGPEEAKGDLQIKARGSTVLLQREIAREFLPQLYPLSQDPQLRINPEKLAVEICRSQGFRLEDVQYSEDEWNALQDQLSQQPPPQDPRIAAAQIRADADAKRTEAQTALERQRMEFDAQQHAEQRAVDAYLADLEVQVQVMELGNRKEISLAEVKAMLAKAAADSRDKRAEMQLKLSPANPTNQGI